jgi:hypothetical protein
MKSPSDAADLGALTVWPDSECGHGCLLRLRPGEKVVWLKRKCGKVDRALGATSSVGAGSFDGGPECGIGMLIADQLTTWTRGIPMADGPKIVDIRPGQATEPG